MPRGIDSWKGSPDTRLLPVLVDRGCIVAEDRGEKPCLLYSFSAISIKKEVLCENYRSLLLRFCCRQHRLSTYLLSCQLPLDVPRF
jgi:hypothetical protein